jgi:hypothetical protein
VPVGGHRVKGGGSILTGGLPRRRNGEAGPEQRNGGGRLRWATQQE